MGEAQKREGLRHALPALPSVLCGEPPEFDQSRFLGVQGQAEFLNTSPQFSVEPFGFAGVLESHAEVVGLSNEARRDLAVTVLQVGYLLSHTGRPAGAEAEFRAAMAMCQKLDVDHLAGTDFRDSVASSFTNVNDLDRPLGRAPEARGGYERAIALRERVVRENPTIALYRSYLAYSMRRHRLALRDLSDPAAAAADAWRAQGLYEGLPSRLGQGWFETACCHAALASLAGTTGSGVSAGDGPAVADRAMEWPRKAAGRLSRPKRLPHRGGPGPPARPR
jgi:tetratricopeptide (TPR) repeat protein